MRILVFAPHPDDADVGAGGLLIRAARKHHAIHLAVMTDGSSGGDPAVRNREQIRATRHYGQGPLHLFPFPDTALTVNAAVVTKLEGLIRSIDPELILLPWEQDTHQDHRATAAAVMSAARYRPNLLAYETPTSVDFEPTVYAEIDLDAKLLCVQEHASQLGKPRNVLEAVQATAAFRGWHARTQAAEGYRAIRLTINGLFGI